MVGPKRPAAGKAEQIFSSVSDVQKARSVACSRFVHLKEWEPSNVLWMNRCGFTTYE